MYTATVIPLHAPSLGTCWQAMEFCYSIKDRHNNTEKSFHCLQYTNVPLPLVVQIMFEKTLSRLLVVLSA